MYDDVWRCGPRRELTMCALYWSTVISEEKWPDEWEQLALKEFDDAAQAIEALAAQQAE